MVIAADGARSARLKRHGPSIASYGGQRPDEIAGARDRGCDRGRDNEVLKESREGVLQHGFPRLFQAVGACCAAPNNRGHLRNSGRQYTTFAASPWLSFLPSLRSQGAAKAGDLSGAVDRAESLLLVLMPQAS